MDALTRWTKRILLYANWLNSIVYQTTPYNLYDIQIVKEFKDKVQGI